MTLSCVFVRVESIIWENFCENVDWLRAWHTVVARHRPVRIRGRREGGCAGEGDRSGGRRGHRGHRKASSAATPDRRDRRDGETPERDNGGTHAAGNGGPDAARNGDRAAEVGACDLRRAGFPPVRLAARSYASAAESQVLDDRARLSAAPGPHAELRAQPRGALPGAFATRSYL